MVNHVVVYSGGMDSFTLLHWVLRFHTQPMDKVHAVSFDYGQRHREREIEMAQKVTSALGIPHTLIHLLSLRDLTPRSALTGSTPVPHGHYAAETMKQTVVPGRNTVMLAMALALAEGLDDTENAIVYYGAHAGDHHIYPDCRPKYIHAMAQVMRWASDGRVGLSACFEHLSKSGILRLGLETTQIPVSAYADTHSCYEGTEQPCGKCGACVERAEAFADNHAIDPLLAAVSQK